MPLFPHEANLTIDVTNLLGGILYPFAASFLFPVSLNINHTHLISITLNTPFKSKLELNFNFVIFF